MFVLKTEFVTNGGNFCWSFIISGTLKEWSSFYLLTVNFVFASITWGTFSFSFYSHFLIFTLSSMAVFPSTRSKGFFCFSVWWSWGTWKRFFNKSFICKLFKCLVSYLLSNLLVLSILFYVTGILTVWNKSFKFCFWLSFWIPGHWRIFFKSEGLTIWFDLL